MKYSALISLQNLMFNDEIYNKRAMMALYRSTGWYLEICLKHKTPKKG